MPVLTPARILAQHVCPDTKFERLLVNLLNHSLLLLNSLFNPLTRLLNSVALALQLIDPVLDLARVSPCSSRQHIAKLLQLLCIRLLVLDVNWVKQLLIIVSLLCLQLFNRLVYFNFLFVVNCFLLDPLLKDGHEGL